MDTKFWLENVARSGSLTDVGVYGKVLLLFILKT
jgi:hypothetical protein